MKAKTHSILSVVNGHTTNAIPQSKPDLKQHDKKSPAAAPWGILFGAEYIWAPFFGPMLMVYPSNASKAGPKNTNGKNKHAISPCCILLFDNQLSTCSSLHVFHTN